MTHGFACEFQDDYVSARNRVPFSNSVEYEAWYQHWCASCAVDDLHEGGEGCPLLLVALAGKTPADWSEHAPQRYNCGRFRRRS